MRRVSQWSGGRGEVGECSSASRLACTSLPERNEGRAAESDVCHSKVTD